MGEIEWRARYAAPTQPDLLMMASVLAAYQELIVMPAKKRDRIIKELRKGPGIVLAAAKEGTQG
ncbi:hypothetical protein [Comamonas thiooxydans]|uniref:hypothetical protein n=1 Tax=Comamonas thiooxydans TaxID=363952 RepID=UPI00103FA56F|nr:hypothetical protein [Comamonas thiooxydans]